MVYMFASRVCSPGVGLSPFNKCLKSTKMELGTVNGVAINTSSDLASVAHDGVVLVTYPHKLGMRVPQLVEEVVASALELDAALENEVAVLNCPRVSGKRLILSPTGAITAYDDVRSVGEAAKRGIIRALKAGVRKPILVVQSVKLWPESELVLLLGALEALYVPLQLREAVANKKTKLLSLTVYGEALPHPLEAVVRNAVALEAARVVARDIGGGDPERMCAPNVATYVHEAFKNTSVSVRVVQDVKVFEKEYPLFAAVNRAANTVERHQGRIIYLEYTGADPVERTVMLVGKGVTYDTGGADIKAGGIMAGMSRDKCGAAAVAGFLKACELLKPKGLRVVGVMGMARNSVGEESYVADEVVTSRSGRRVRIGNTDAEGRMVMGDLLFEMKERALKEINPHIYTIATLTGHAHRAVGPGYSIVMDNHAAREANHAPKFRASGDSIADMVEISTIRREDVASHKGQGEGDDVLQANNKPSTMNPRGHQGPAGFLLLVSDLDRVDIKYSHLDIAASGGDLPHEPTGAPLLALAHHYKLINY